MSIFNKAFIEKFFFDLNSDNDIDGFRLADVVKDVNQDSDGGGSCGYYQW